ncbi:MAG: YiiX/YebB-like N1pC/P60 family cysteine hydrolase [Myxococcota bacterium]|nr:YiiX/YebB-like N1pC/P60 family cysteine hydrolase [Myxococcota bacterium]
MNDLVLIGLSVLFPIVAFVVLATRILHPHHRRLAFALYALGWIPFLLSVNRHRELVEDPAQAAASLFSSHWLQLGVVGCLLVLGYAAWTLFPAARSFLGQASDEELEELLNEDLSLLRYMLFRMNSTLLALLDSGLFEKGLEPLSESEELRLRLLWRDFVEASFECDVLKQQYKAFPQVNVLTRSSQHTRCFLVAYGAFLAQYRAGLLVTEAVGGSPAIKALLNEADLAIPAGSFAAIQKNTVHPEVLVQLNAGRGYLALVEGKLPTQQDILAQIRAQLSDIDRVAQEETQVFVGNPLDYLERKAFGLWLPVQKAVAIQMSHVRTVRRDNFIPPEVVGRYAAQLEPGDILLERREWQLTNLGIPGYWTHLALYVGSPERLDSFFADGRSSSARSASDLLFARCSQAQVELGSPDDEGYARTVIEALRPGVVLNSLEVSASTDAVAVLRPRLSREKRLEGLFRAFTHLGKPYDYNFDFATDSALVCSELIYKAFRELTILSPEASGGRLLLAPNQLAERFDESADEGQPDLDFVLFLDGLGEVGSFTERDEAAFRSSWRRPKWHVLTREAEEV